jgi:geranylgeranyl diphosphate synthase, type II
MLTLAYFTNLIEKEIKGLEFSDKPNELYDPVKYIMHLGGKRIRPALTLMTASLFSDEYIDALPAAMAIEIFHNFTLMHDDIMDKASVRRGKATVHTIWNENTAILSGDATLIFAYQHLAQLSGLHLQQAFKVFNKTAIEVCEGQQLDMNFEKKHKVTIPEYLEMIRLKTSVLLAGSMQIGAIVGGADKQVQKEIYSMGQNLGMAFQLQDDYLDVYGDTAKFGKAKGGDIVNNKKTYLLIRAMNSENKALLNELNIWISKSGFTRGEKINAVKAIYDELGLGNEAQLAAIGYINNAIEILGTLDVPAERKKPLEEIMFQLMYRDK